MPLGEQPDRLEGTGGTRKDVSRVVDKPRFSTALKMKKKKKKGKTMSEKGQAAGKALFSSIGSSGGGSSDAF